MSSQQQLSTTRYLEQAMADQDLQDSLPVEKTKTGHWPPAMTVICVLFFLIGIIFAISAAWGGYSLMQDPVIPENAGSQQKEIFESAVATRTKYFPILVYLEVFKLAMAGLMMFTIVMLIARNEKARSLAIGVCGLALFFHVCSIGMSIMIVGETGNVLNSFLDDTFAKVDATGEEKEVGKNLVKNYIANGATFFLAIAFLCRLAFYGSIMAYMWTDDVKRIFGEDAMESMKKQTDSEIGDPSLA